MTTSPEPEAAAAAASSAGAGAGAAESQSQQPQPENETQQQEQQQPGSQPQQPEASGQQYQDQQEQPQPQTSEPSAEETQQALDQQLHPQEQQQEQQQEASPSADAPAPPPPTSEQPTSSTTAPPQQPPPPKPRPPPPIPGPRAARFQSLFAESLRRTLGRLNYDNFASCYPTLASNAPQVLRSIQAQMVTLLEDRCKREFEQIMLNRDVVGKLNELETLMAEAARRRSESNGAEPPTPPHLLPPLTILRAHLAPHLAAHHSQLNARLQNTQAHNARLRDDIGRQRAEINALLSLVEAASTDINAANAALGGVVDELAEEARAVDAEMAGTAA